MDLIGHVEVTSLERGRALGLVTSACVELEVGDPIQPLLQQEVSTSGAVSPLDPNRLVTPRVTDATVVFGTSYSMCNPVSGSRRNMAMWSMYAAGAVITIDQGRADG